MNILLDLFLTFAKIGLFTFGGGYAMIALIENTCVEKKQWISHDEMMNITVIAESTPGPIAINCATFVGYKQKGFVGALAATFGVVLPSFAVILAIFYVLRQFRDLKVVQYAFRGIRAGVLVLMLKALYKMFKTNRKGGMAYILMILAFVLTTIWKVNTFLVILLCGLLGLVSSLMAGRRMAQ